MSNFAGAIRTCLRNVFEIISFRAKQTEVQEICRMASDQVLKINPSASSSYKTFSNGGGRLETRLSASNGPK
jgi:hypothetical protein